MSHIVKEKAYVTDLDVLGTVADGLGLELVRDKTTFRDYYHATHGKCLHVIRRKDQHPKAYEIGVIAREDGQPGYQLAYDPWGEGGNLLHEKAGLGLEHLKVGLGQEIAARELARKNYRVLRTTHPETGRPRLYATKSN